MGAKKKEVKPVPRRKPSAGAKGKKKPLRLKAGGTYENRNGSLRGPLEINWPHSQYFKTHPYRDPDSLDTYTRSGRYLSAKQNSNWDLIREVVKRRGK